MAANPVTSFLLRTMKNHLAMRAQRGLYGNPVLHELGEPYPLPKGEGYNMNIPVHVSQNLWRKLTEFTIMQPSGTSATSYQISVAGYADGRKYSDFWRIVNSLPSHIPNDVDDMMRFGGKKIDDLCRSAISGKGLYHSGSAVTSATRLQPRDIYIAGAKLATKNAPVYSDGLYRGVIPPKGQYDLLANLSGGSTMINPNQFVVNTETGAQKLERLTAGVMGRVRLLESTWSPRQYTGTSTTSSAGLATGATGYEMYVCGRGEFAVVDLATARLQTIVHPPGSAGSYDAADQIGTVACKFYFGAGAMDTTNRLYRIVFGDSHWNL